MPLRVKSTCGVSWLLKKVCIPADTCMCLTADRCTLIVVYEMLRVARWEKDNIKVVSVAGKLGTFIPLQKVVNLIWPAEYILFVEAAKPLV